MENQHLPRKEFFVCYLIQNHACILKLQNDIKWFCFYCLVLFYRSPSKGPNTENALAKRVRFGARIVTKNGRDAHRELNGFFFSADNTLTLYEFHQFGTRFVY